ncbi:hypothetical protein B0H10DRAFT_1991245 [Mycena sp. CBHHK59/15]|nr:hypothetical protein B0H10DRAFT_1991245 [Mycena sp. CBHHK59/15]
MSSHGADLKLWCKAQENRSLETMATFFQRFSFRKDRTSPVTNVNEEDGRAGNFSDRTQAFDRNFPAEPSPPTEIPDAPRKARNMLKFALKTLSSVSSNIPFGSMLSSIIDPLLDITDRIEQTSANTQGLIELAARIELLTPIISEMAKDKPKQGRVVVEALKWSATYLLELQSMTKDLSDASSQGKLDQFFNSTDNASSLEKHNATLAQMIADSTLVTVPEVLQSLQDLERSKLLQSSPPIVTKGQIEMGDITGGLGGTGGNARIGGEGGDGEGPKLDMSPEEHWKIGNISGGTGGTGGIGVDVGGKGGTGKAPVISVLRRNRALIVQPQREQEEEFSIL